MVGLHDSPLRKPYSIASAPWEVEQSGMMQVLVLIDDSGSPDPHLELANPGTLLDVEGPFGSFRLPADTGRPVLFVAGGTGIAPLRSMLIERLAQPETPPISLIYSARSPEEFGFRAELDALSARGRINLHYTVTRDDAASWSGRRGLIDAALVQHALPSPESLCLLCGPPALVSDTRELLTKLGVSAERILVEGA
jgi:CDP-4-dehydro-6-deoxyglucose reductase